jgi:hypothetical protein
VQHGRVWYHVYVVPHKKTHSFTHSMEEKGLQLTRDSSSTSGGKTSSGGGLSSLKSKVWRSPWGGSDKRANTPTAAGADAVNTNSLKPTITKSASGLGSFDTLSRILEEMRTW